jgi:hypothetical protein
VQFTRTSQDNAGIADITAFYVQDQIGVTE